MTDERTDNTTPGGDEPRPDALPATPPAEPAARPSAAARREDGEGAPPLADAWDDDDTPDAGVGDDRDDRDDRLDDAPDADRADEGDRVPADGGDADDADAEAEADDGRRRPRLAVIIGAVLLLAAIGAGLAFLLPSGPVRLADQLVPSATAGAEQLGGEAAGQPTVPTALPLPEATGEYSSTEVIAQVGDGAVFRGDFVRQYQPGQDPGELLNQLIQIQLIIQAASGEGVSADAATVDQQVSEIKQAQAGGDDAQFQLFLDQARVGSEENLRRLIEQNVILEQMILRHTTAEQARARHILLATDATTDTARLDELKTEAEGLMQDLDGGADFAAIAAERSDDPGSKESGGDLGWAPRGLFVGPFDEAVFSMQAGERRLVQTDFGWHIIELLDEATMRPFDSTDMLQTPAGQQAFAETFIPWIDELQQQAEADNRITIVVPAEQLVSQPAGS